MVELYVLTTAVLLGVTIIQLSYEYPALNAGAPFSELQNALGFYMHARNSGLAILVNSLAAITFLSLLYHVIGVRDAKSAQLLVLFLIIGALVYAVIIPNIFGSLPQGTAETVIREKLKVVAMGRAVLLVLTVGFLWMCR